MDAAGAGAAAGAGGSGAAGAGAGAGAGGDLSLLCRSAVSTWPASPHASLPKQFPATPCLTTRLHCCGALYACTQHLLLMRGHGLFALAWPPAPCQLPSVLRAAAAVTCLPDPYLRAAAGGHAAGGGAGEGGDAAPAHRGV